MSEYQVVRSWQGCLALTFLGESVEYNDEKILNNSSIKLRWYNWAYFAIDLLFKELEESGFDEEKLIKAHTFHKQFIEHFDEKTYDKL